MRLPDDDAEFIEYLAALRPSSPVPEGGIHPMIDRAVSLGVMPEPPGWTLVADVWLLARDSARDFLAR